MQKLKIAPLALSILVATMPGLAQANQPKTPYLANPVALHRYINKVVPNVAIIVDNSNIMQASIPKRTGPTSNDARQIDVVKAALLNVYPDTYNKLDLALMSLSDVAKDMHWKIDSSAPTGFTYAVGTGNNNINDNTDNIYNYAPEFNGQLQRSLGSGNGQPRLGFNAYKSASLVKVQTYQKELPGLGEKQKYDMGLSLLVPLMTDMYKKISHFTPAEVQDYQDNLDLLTKTMTLSQGDLNDVYPNAIDYLENNIKYRCQDSYVVIITNDLEELTQDKMLETAKKYAKTHPKSSNSRDLEGYYYNQSDFPNQYIKTYLLSIRNSERNNNERGEDFLLLEKFRTYSGGPAVDAAYAKDVLLYLQEFVHEMIPKTEFQGTAPAVYINPNNTDQQMWIHASSNPKGWSSELKFRESINDKDYTSARYANGFPRVFLGGNKDLYMLSNSGDLYGNIVSKNRLTNRDFALDGKENTQEFIHWLIADGDVNGKGNGLTNEKHLGDEAYPQYRTRSYSPESEKRFLGDITNDSIEIMGSYKPSIKAPGILAVASNDGMLKIYRANPLYNIEPDPNMPGLEDLSQLAPYIYEFAYIPGNAKRSDGSTLMENLKYRADPRYGEESMYPAHEYGISGQIAYRTTNKGQTFLVSSIGQGGFGAFALNAGGVAHENSNIKLGLEGSGHKDWATTSFLWDTNSDAFGAAKQGSDAIGHISGRPVISRIAMSRSGGLPNMKSDVRYVAVLPSGEFGDQNKDSGPTLYIYDAIGVNVALGQDKKDTTPGKLIKKVTAEIPKGVSLKYKNSLSAPTLVDLTFDGVADVGYVGDLNGHLYRLDLRGDKASDWKLEMIYEGNPDQPITQAPSVSRFDRKNVVIFGTGSYDKKEDFNGRYAQQAIYGIFEDDNFTGFKDGPLNSQSNFVNQTLSTNMDDDVRSISNNEIEKEHDGWRIALSRSANEALSQKPVVFNGTVFLQTYALHDKRAMPDNAMCYRPDLSPDTWLFQINARTGGILGDDTDTRLEEMGDNYVLQFDSVILPTLKLVRTDESSSMSKDGEMQNGNDRDFDLIELESLSSTNLLRKGHYLDEEGECNAIMTNGMTLICPPFEEILEPGRVSIMKRNAHY